MVLLLPTILLSTLVIHANINTVGACLDVYTQFEGEGPGQPGGEFHPLEKVELYAEASYNDWPEQNVLVAFEVNNANGDLVYCVANITDENGVAYTSFRIPEIDVPGTIGTWFVIVTANIAGIVASDNLTFTVVPRNFTITIKTCFSFLNAGCYPLNGVEVWIDNKFVGCSPVTISVLEGNHQVEVSSMCVMSEWIYCVFKCWEDGVLDSTNVIKVNESLEVIVFYEARFAGPQPR